jgi:hypothetical protein
MDSTYRLKHSASVSAGTVKAICQSQRSENILIIDNNTVSLWNLERLKKAVHFVDLEFETEVVGLESLLHVDGYAAHLQSIESSVHDNSYSFFRVWSSELALLYEVYPASLWAVHEMKPFYKKFWCLSQ